MISYKTTDEHLEEGTKALRSQYQTAFLYSQDAHCPLVFPQVN